MYESCLEKQKKLLSLFEDCLDNESKYNRIIELGKHAPRLSPEYKCEKNIVKGCQSIVYLHAFSEGDKVYFETESDSLISSGLAYLLVFIYSGETAETILKCAPESLSALGLNSILSPNRSNGLYSIHLKMKQEALNFIN